MAPLTIERTATAAAAAVVVFTGVFVHTHNYAAIYGVAVGCGPYGWPLRIYALLPLYKRIAELIKKKVSNTVAIAGHCTSHIFLFSCPILYSMSDRSITIFANGKRLMLPTFGAPLLFHSLYISLRFTSLYVYTALCTRVSIVNYIRQTCITV
jgi:hypothetical protein